MTPATQPQRRAATIFGLTWLSYFFYYLARKNFAAAKEPLQAAYGLSKQDLHWVDQGYLVMYAAGQFLWGRMADRSGSRKVVLGTMAAVAVANLGCGLWLPHAPLAAVLPSLALLLAVNGLAQAGGWPGNGRLIALWFGRKARGRAMGLWSTCYPLGAFAASWLAAALLPWGWPTLFWVPAVLLAVFLVPYAWAVRDPATAADEVPAGASVVAQGAVPAAAAAVPPAAIGEVAGAAPAAEQPPAAQPAAWRLLLCNPHIWLLGGAHFCLKLVRYAVWMWLPYVLERELAYSGQDANRMASLFDFAGLPLLIVVGIGADRWSQRRASIAMGSLLALAVSLLVFALAYRAGPAALGTSLVLVGAALFTADAMVSGVVAQDLGGTAAAALALGIVNGIGSLGAIAQGYLVAYVDSWNTSIWVFLGASIVAAALVAPLWIHERRLLLLGRQNDA